MTATNRNSQAQLNTRISSFIPRNLWRSTVAIVVSRKPTIYLLGTGSLFQVADERFVVTAGHVVRQAHTYDRTIGISGDSKSLISVHGDWMVSTSDREEDPYDVAVFQLPERALARLTQYRFLRISDICLSPESKTGVFTVFGHPGIWATPSRDDHEPVNLKRLEYTAYSYQGRVRDLLDYDPKFHLLLDADPEEVTWEDGSPATFTRRNGAQAEFPRDLSGISGGPVWRIGDLSVPVTEWGRSATGLVGIETGVYQPSRVIRVTRWAAVTTLIHSAFPQLRHAIEVACWI